jgi:hypothetical protein
LQIGQRQEPLTAGVGRSKERFQFFVCQLAVAVRIGSVKHEGAWRRCERVRGKVEIRLAERSIMVSVEAGEIGIRAGEFLAGNPAVTVAVQSLARGAPVEPRLCHRLFEPTFARAELAPIEDIDKHRHRFGWVRPDRLEAL